MCTHCRIGVRGGVALLSLLLATGVAASPAVVSNLTGLPAYPNLNSAAMDGIRLVEALGRQCARFVGKTSDSLAVVENWYRKRLPRASESDIDKDELYSGYSDLSGIKLTVGFDYVAIFTAANQPTIIELHRCDWSI